MRKYFTYILTNYNKTVLYTGMTNDLEQRIIEHYLNRGNYKTFAGRYHCHFLLYYEVFNSPRHAIEREKEIKDLRRSLKEELINEQNPEWNFLNESIMEWPPHPLVTSR